ncbi:hypothetical protein, partial [Staphylococcus shinii]
DAEAIAAGVLERLSAHAHSPTLAVVLPHQAATTAAGEGAGDVASQPSNTSAPATLDWLNDDLFAA